MHVLYSDVNMTLYNTCVFFCCLYQKIINLFLKFIDYTLIQFPKAIGSHIVTIFFSMFLAIKAPKTTF